MAAALELHDELIAAHRGGARRPAPEVEGRGRLDAHRVPRARRTPSRARRRSSGALAAVAGPAASTLRVRIALHTGEAHERGGDYFGPALNRAARLRGLATGGVTVLSQATAEIVHDRLPAGAELVDLGTHELRGLSRPEASSSCATPARPPRRACRREARDPQDGDRGVRRRGRGRRRRRGLDPEARRRVSVALRSPACATVLERHGGEGGGLSGRRADGRLRRARCSTRTTRFAPCGPRPSCARPGRRSRTSWSGTSASARHARRGRHRRGDRASRPVRAAVASGRRGERREAARGAGGAPARS